jgi:hypothetical protein
MSTGGFFVPLRVVHLEELVAIKQLISYLVKVLGGSKEGSIDWSTKDLVELGIWTVLVFVLNTGDSLGQVLETPMCGNPERILPRAGENGVCCWCPVCIRVTDFHRWPD